MGRRPLLVRLLQGPHASADERGRLDGLRGLRRQVQPRQRRDVHGGGRAWRVCGTAPIPDGEGLSQFAERICTEKTGVAGQGGCFAQIVTLPNGNAVPVGFQPGTTLLYKCKRCGPFWPDNCGCHDDLPCPSNHDWVGGPEGACQNTG